MKKKVLFLCTGNSCRSQMAKAIVNAKLGERWEAASAGIKPAGYVHPKALAVLAEIGIQHSGRSKLVDEAPKAVWYFSDAFDIYYLLWYHFGRYAVLAGKSDTYSVEADNAEMRHYLARLARSSRCFSRCPYELYCALRLFVNCYNQRQLKSRLFPAYSFNLIDFVHSPF